MWRSAVVSAPLPVGFVFPSWSNGAYLLPPEVVIITVKPPIVHEGRESRELSIRFSVGLDVEQ